MMPQPDTATKTDLVTLLTFTVAEQIYGLPVTNIARIIEMVAITHLPDMPDTLQGIINLQGKAVPVMDMRRRLGLPHKPYGLHTPIILTMMDDDRIMGLIVDAVEDVAEVLAKNTETADTIVPAGVAKNTPRAPLAGIAKMNRQMILILNPQGLLSQSEYVELSQALGIEDRVNGGPGEDGPGQGYRDNTKSGNHRQQKE